MMNQSKENAPYEQNQFYINYMATQVTCNGVSYNSFQIKSIHRVDADNSTAYRYQIETENGQKGVLSLSTKAANFNSAKRFIENCNPA